MHSNSSLFVQVLLVEGQLLQLFETALKRQSMWQFDVAIFNDNAGVEVLQRHSTKFPTYVPLQAPPQLKSFTIAPT